ncbi:hypothetical protein MUG91_G717n2 [Manis pentadactyla]|nr:hypothetical protein MUG91_G717n2 [Manis pentadactyla]
MMLGVPRRGRGRTPGVGGARDAPSAARRPPAAVARVSTAQHAASREATPASRAAAGSTAGGERAPGPLPPRACSGRTAGPASSPRWQNPFAGWGGPDTAPGCAAPARMPAVPGAGPRLPATRPVRGATGGRSLASQRRLPGSSGSARPAPPGGLQLSGLPRGLFPRLLPPPPQGSTRAVEAAASALPRSWDVRPLLDSINALEEASQCLTLLQPSLVPLTDTRESRKENEPPAPWIGRSITVEEYYQEKQAQSRWLKTIFEDKTALPSHGLHTPVWQALATPAPTTAITFSQSLPSAIQTDAGSSTASFGGFSGTLTTSASITPSQPALTISSTTTPASNIPFSSGTRPPVPSYPGVTPQHTFRVTDRQQMWTASQHWPPASTAPFHLEAQQPWPHPSQPLAALCGQVFMG